MRQNIHVFIICEVSSHVDFPSCSHLIRAFWLYHVTRDSAFLKFSLFCLVLTVLLYIWCSKYYSFTDKLGQHTVMEERWKYILQTKLGWGRKVWACYKNQSIYKWIGNIDYTMVLHVLRVFKTIGPVSLYQDVSWMCKQW